MAKMDAIPATVSANVLSQCQVNGAVPVTAEQFQAMMADFYERMRVRDARTSCTENAAGGNIVPENDRPNMWLWGGRHHMVPEGFKFPKSNVLTLWNLYVKEMLSLEQL